MSESTGEATPGPWRAEGSLNYLQIYAGERGTRTDRTVARVTTEEDALLIVRAVNALPVLVGALDRLIRTIEEYEPECPIVVQRAADDASAALKLARGAGD